MKSSTRNRILRIWPSRGSCAARARPAQPPAGQGSRALLRPPPCGVQLAMMAMQMLNGLNYLHRQQHQVHRHAESAAFGAAERKSSLAFHGTVGSWLLSLINRSGRATWLPCRDALVAARPASRRPFGAFNSQVHPDLKPANVMINTRGQVKISDFGIFQRAGIESTNGMAKMPILAAP